MKGAVLGYDAATFRGMIRGEDDVRYEFAWAEWKGRASPRAGQAVDFVLNGREAIGVYPLDAIAAAGGGAGLSFDSANMRFSLAFAALIVAGAFLPLVEATGFRSGAHALYGFYLTHSLFSSGAGTLNAVNAAAGVSYAASGYLLLGVYAIPALALWVAVADFRGGSGPRLRLIAGLVALGALFVLPLIVSWLAATAQGYGAAFINAIDWGGVVMAPFGIGWLLILIGGALLALSGLGLIPNGAAAISSAGATAFTPAPSPSSSAPAYAPPPPAYAPPAPTYAPATPGAVASGAPAFVFRPALILSVAILAGCFLPLFDFPGQTVDGNSVLGMFDRLQLLIASLNARSGQSLGLANLLYLAYLIPLLAGWLFISELTNRNGTGASPTMRTLTGFWAFLAPAALFVALPQFATVEWQAPPFGPGGLVILGAGALLLLNVAGLIPTTGRRA